MKKILTIFAICCLVALPFVFAIAQETTHDTTHQAAPTDTGTVAPSTSSSDHAEAGVQTESQTHGETPAEGHEGGEEKENKNELPSLFTFLVLWLGHDYAWLELWAPIFFAFATSIFFMLVIGHVYRRRAMIPGKLQNFVELLVEGMYNFIYSILGEETKKYIPLVGTLFFYILMNNLWGLIPLGHSPTVKLEVTGSMAAVVFLVSQYTGIKRLGFGGWLYHLIGQPVGVAMWVLTPIFLLIHVIGEIAKPASLALRLFGNITGEDTLVAAFVGLGITALAFVHSPVGLPFNTPIILFCLLLSIIQALVFTLLSTIYILMMLPHEEHATH